MFGRKKKPSFMLPFPLHFKDGAAAVEYASRFMVCKLTLGAELPAVVLDARTQFGATEAVRVTEDGVQTAALQVCGDGGGFVTLSQTAGPKGPKLAPGDLVLWRAFQYLEDMGKRSPDKRSGWVGLITGVLAPTLQEEGWVGKDRFGA